MSMMNFDEGKLSKQSLIYDIKHQPKIMTHKNKNNFFFTWWLMREIFALMELSWISDKRFAQYAINV